MTPDYGAWLGSMNWDFFLTITFREPCPSHRQESVTHSAGQFITHKVTTRRLFLGAEPHISTNTHLHGLISLTARDPYMIKLTGRMLWHDLEKRFGRCQVAVPRGAEHVANYCAKYCTKAMGYYEIW